MFEIDLLKGKGKPPRNSIGKMMLKMVPFLIPLMAMVAWAASFRQDCALIEMHRAEAQKNEIIINDACTAMRQYRNMTTQRNQINKCLQTIVESISYRIQVTDLLVELVQTMPDDIFISEISLNRSAILEKSKDKESDAAEKKEDKGHLVVQRKMELILCGFDQTQSEQAVRKYVDSLKESKLLSEIFSDIKPSARQQGTVNKQPATFYEIECTLWEQR